MAPEEVAKVELSIERSHRRFSGRTIDARGFAVANAQITIRSLRAQSLGQTTVESGIDGTFEHDRLPPPPYRIEARHPNFAPTVHSEIHEATLEIELKPGAIIAGRVVDDWTDNPLADATIDLRQSDGNVRQQYRTSNEGEFEFRNISSGNYLIYLSHSNFVSREVSVALETTRRGLEDIDIGSIRLLPGAEWRGAITDANGDAVAGAEVTWGDPGRWSRSVRTDPRGRFALGGVPPPAAILVARHPTAGTAASPQAIAARPRETHHGISLRLPRRRVSQGCNRRTQGSRPEWRFDSTSPTETYPSHR